ncbi:hypothetical protein D1BOALGB6SA_6743 [Olavius sp. associated proteobacterium Delta 1]|nr:hypothetical protein D1BOALGB6SA_6743 [Olavius sp. associated proteobacterium Delta 1]
MLTGKKTVVGVVLLLVIAVGSAGPLAAETTVLRVGNWVPGFHLITKAILEPWTQAIEKESAGTLKFEIMTSALGRPNTYWDLVVDGTIDVGWGVSGHNPGRFTMTQVVDLPFMSPDPWAGSAAMWLTYAKYGHLYGEHKGAKVVGLYAHSNPNLNMRDEAVLKAGDLKGKKIRVGGNMTGKMVSMLGGTPVQLPPTEAQQAMARGVADGITFPAESIAVFKITPVIKNVTHIPGGLYTDTFWMAINDAKWKSLTDQQQQAILKHSGLGIAMLAGWAWTNGDNVGMADMNKAGVKFHTLSDSEVQNMKETLQPLIDEWIAEANKRGLKGQEIYDYAKSMAHEYRAIRKVNVP